MARYEGSAGSVKIKSGSDALTAVASVRSWSMDITRDTVEDTSMGSSGVRTYKKGLQSYSGSMDIVYDDSEDTIVSTALDPATDDTVSVELFPDGSVTATKFAGDVIVTSYSVTASYDGITEASVSFTGTGAITTSTI
jgi:predicted secreted protein